MRRTRNVNPQSQSEWRKAKKDQGEVKRGNGTDFNCNGCLPAQCAEKEPNFKGS